MHGTRLFGSSQRKISGSNRRPEKVVLFFLMKYYKQKFDTSFRPSRPFFSKWNWLYKWYPVPGSQDSGEKSFSQSKGVKRNAKNARGLGGDRALSPIFPAATAPFPKSRASYFRSVRFNIYILSESLAQASLLSSFIAWGVIQSFFENVVFLGPRLNIPIFLPVFGWKYSCI